MQLKSGSSSKSSKELARCATHPRLSASLSEYMLRDKIGEGAFGKVFVAETLSRRSHRTKHVALKVIRRKDLKKDSTKHLAVTEISNLKHLSATGSLFFTQLVETFHDDLNLYIVTDLLRGGTLRQEMSHRGWNMMGDRILFVMAQLVEVLAQLRAARIIHRDIKPDNILLDALGNITLADMGMSRRFDPSESVPFGPTRAESTSGSQHKVFNDCLTTTGCGTLPYAAPEMFRRGTYSFQADIYSVGVIFHELLFGKQPHHASQVQDLFKHGTLYQWHIPDHCKEIKPEAADLCRKLLATRPDTRIDVEGLREHAFFKTVNWPTLAARAYDLPEHYAPPLAKIDDAELLNAAIFAEDTIQKGKHSNNQALELAYSCTNISSIAARPDDPRTLRGRTKKLLANLKHDLRYIQDQRKSSSGEFPVRRRNWAKDAKHIMGKTYVVMRQCFPPTEDADNKKKEAKKNDQIITATAREAKSKSTMRFCVPSEPESSFHHSLAALYDRVIRDKLALTVEPSSSYLRTMAGPHISASELGSPRPPLQRMSPLTPGLDLSTVAICGSPNTEVKWLLSHADDKGASQKCSSEKQDTLLPVPQTAIAQHHRVEDHTSNTDTVVVVPAPVTPIANDMKIPGVSQAGVTSPNSTSAPSAASFRVYATLLFPLSLNLPSDSANSAAASASSSRLSMSAHCASLLRTSRTSYFPPFTVPSLGGSSLDTADSTIPPSLMSFSALSRESRLGSSLITESQLEVGSGASADGKTYSGLEGRVSDRMKRLSGWSHRKRRDLEVEVYGLPVVRSPLSYSSTSSQDEELFPVVHIAGRSSTAPCALENTARKDMSQKESAADVAPEGLPVEPQALPAKMDIFSTERLRAQTSQEALQERERIWRQSIFQTTTTSLS